VAAETGIVTLTSPALALALQMMNARTAMQVTVGFGGPAEFSFDLGLTSIVRAA